MCRLAFCEDIYEISSIELDRGSKSYTVETLRELKKIYPEDELYFIFGSDMLSTFTQWYCWEEILSLAFICAASREKGYEPDLSAFTDEQKKRFVFLDIEPLEVSSTELRGIIARDEESELLDKKVSDYITQNNLYDDGLSEYRKIITEKLDAYRLHHSECVSECAAALAEQYGADVEKARIAGLLHDVMKNTGADRQLLELFRAGIFLDDVEKKNFKVWHQFSGAAFLKNEKIVDDEEILNAVMWHTTGRADMSLLEKVVYIADFISADRNYPDVGVVRKLASQSLEEAIFYTARYTINKLVSADLPVHPATVDCYNDMILQKGKSL